MTAGMEYSKTLAVIDYISNSVIIYQFIYVYVHDTLLPAKQCTIPSTTSIGSDQGSGTSVYYALVLIKQYFTSINKLSTGLAPARVGYKPQELKIGRHDVLFKRTFFFCKSD